MKKIIITGGAGFIGSILIKEMISSKEYEILNIDSMTYAGSLTRFTDDEIKSFTSLELDICSKNLYKVFLDFRPDAIIHLAAESHVDNSINSPEIFLQTNILGTYNLLEISREYQSKINKKFIFHHVSTDEVFGDLEPDEESFYEGSHYRPSSPYSASKASSDHLVRAWSRTFKLPIKITNCSNNYGPYQYPEKLIPNVIISAISGKKIPIYGNGSQIRDWIYVGDHAKGLLKVLKDGVIGETYLIGGDSERTNLHIVNSICNILDSMVHNKPNGILSFKELIEFVKDRPGHDKRYSVNSARIKLELDWKVDENLESGLLKTVEWYLENKDWWKPFC
jgi:dTDP-glucose 4,6-dehydratase